MEEWRRLYHRKHRQLVKKDKRRYLLEVDVKYPKGLRENDNNLAFLVEKMKIGREEKLVLNLKNERDMWYTSKHWIKH